MKPRFQCVPAQWKSGFTASDSRPIFRLDRRCECFLLLGKSFLPGGVTRAGWRRAGKSRAPIIRLVPRKAEEAAPEDAGSKSARTRERILDAAAHVLSRKGYAGTRLSDVADQAEIQAPAIYYYFPSRDDLVEEVMWTGIARMREHMTRVLAAMPSGADPLARIDAAVEAHLRYCLEISDYT